MEVRIFEDCPKRGETYSGWFFIASKDGHIVKTEGGYGSREEAEKAASVFSGNAPAGWWSGYVIDFGSKGLNNLTAQTIPSAVGMRGLSVHNLGDFDFRTEEFNRRYHAGEIRLASHLRERRA